MRRSERLLVVALGVAAFVLGLAICHVLPIGDAFAQGVGIFTTSATGTRTNCAALTDPVTGQTWCLEGSSRQVKVWTGTTWATVSLGNVAPLSFVIGSQTNTINDYYRYTATGTQQQIGLFLDMVATNTAAPGFFRIPLALRVQTGGGTGAEGIEGLNIVAQQNAADDVAFANALELTFNNLKRDDPLNPVDQNHFGMTIDVYGGRSTGPAALAIRSGAVNSLWQRGIWIPASTIGTNGYAFDYEGNLTDGAVRITNDAQLQVARSVSVGTPSAGDPGAGAVRVASAVYLNATQTLWNGGTAAGTPRCTNNCGTAPAVVGTNSAMRVTVGAGTRSPFLVLFNGTWNATPACLAQLDTGTTATVSVVNATATGVTINTLTGPANGNVFAIHCLGVG